MANDQLISAHPTLLQLPFGHSITDLEFVVGLQFVGSHGVSNRDRILNADLDFSWKQFHSTDVDLGPCPRVGPARYRPTIRDLTRLQNGFEGFELRDFERLIRFGIPQVIGDIDARDRGVHLTCIINLQRRSPEVPAMRFGDKRVISVEGRHLDFGSGGPHELVPGDENGENEYE